MTLPPAIAPFEVVSLRSTMRTRAQKEAADETLLSACTGALGSTLSSTIATSGPA